MKWMNGKLMNNLHTIQTQHAETEDEYILAEHYLRSFSDNLVVNLTVESI